MTKLILKDGFEIKLRDSSDVYSISSIRTEIESYDELKELVEKLTVGNLSSVQFVQDDEEALSTYTDLMLSGNALIISTNTNPIVVAFSLRERTSEEKKQADVDMAISYLSDEQAATVKELYPQWDLNTDYEVGDRVQYETKLYKCLQQHHSQSDWAPDVAHSLWAEILTSPGEILPWKQPDSTNGYHKGDKVTHKDQTWESDIDNNVWEPGVVGTESSWHTV